MSKTVKFTEDNFVNEVLNSDQPVLVDFWAEWCGPCRAVGPTIDALATEYEGRVKVGKMNIDDSPRVTAQFGIQSIPAVVLFKQGRIVDTLVGVQPKQKYESALDQIAA